MTEQEAAQRIQELEDDNWKLSMELDCKRNKLAQARALIERHENTINALNAKLEQAVNAS